MKLSQLALIVALSAVTAFAVGKYIAPTGTNGAATHKETAYERVMRTGTLKCGYALFPPFLDKDVNTGKFSGYYYDLLEEVGKRLSLKIDWAEEVGAANLFEGLKTNRYDAVCIHVNATPGRARMTEFTKPFIYLPLFVYARAGDTRFDNNLQSINDPSVKIAFLEGEISQIVREEDFPKSSIISLPNFADFSQVLLQVTMKKADVVMIEPSIADEFLAKNPDAIRRVTAPPVRMQAVGLSVAIGEEALKSLLNTTIESLHSTGFTERLFIKTPHDKDMYFLPTQPWRRAE